MTLNEKEALIYYLEARLLDLCMKAEHHWYDGSMSMMYNDMYTLLEDFESSIEGCMELTKVE